MKDLVSFRVCWKSDLRCLPTKPLDPFLINAFGYSSCKSRKKSVFGMRIARRNGRRDSSGAGCCANFRRLTNRFWESIPVPRVMLLVAMRFISSSFLSPRSYRRSDIALYASGCCEMLITLLTLFLCFSGALNLRCFPPDSLLPARRDCKPYLQANLFHVE